MILDFFEGDLNGDSWEELCQSCYKMRFKDDHYTEVPASHLGDGGIEGFTKGGIVIQCYCHEKNFTDSELYNHQRDKMTTDINKLLNSKYKKVLGELGVHDIKEWHFVIPYYKDNRILKHAETKKQEVLKKKEANPQQYDYINNEFNIVIYTAEHFKCEITNIIRTTLTDKKLNLAVRKVEIPDWDFCESDKVENIKRKVKAVYGDYTEDDLEAIDDINLMVNTYIESYIKGMEIFRVLRESYTEIFEDVFQLKKAYAKEVKLKTRMNRKQSLNQKIFWEVLDDFEKKLKETCHYFTVDSIIELKTDIISMWLADCSMEFRR